MKKKKSLGWLKFGIIIYCLIGIGLYYLQEKILFRPTKLSEDTSFHFTQPFKETTLDIDADTKWHMIQFTVPDSVRKGLVLYFHGNKENVNHYAENAIHFTKNGYEVWMPDYPGYGKSTGEFSEKKLYEQALQVYKLARVKYQPEQIVIYGRSVGTGIATELASIRDCRNLILETPYYSITSLFRIIAWMYPLDLMLPFKIPTHEYMDKVTAPVTIFHGTNDFVVPYFNAKRLKEHLKPTDEFVTIEGGGHNTLFEFPIMQKKIDSLLH
jgi:alpha-beta hydrolase superfamily lysophospholipase